MSEPFLNKVAGPTPTTLCKKKYRHMFSSVNFAKFLRISLVGCFCFPHEIVVNPQLLLPNSI